MANQGKRMVPEYLIKKIGEGGGGTEYTAGTGIDISANNEISVDTETVALKSDLATVATTGDYDDLTNKPTIPDAVSGTNDGTNWTSLTIGSTTKAIPSGGGSADADEKTIVTNGEGKLETAVGGWKETQTIEIGDYTLPGNSGSDWDLVDSNLSGYLYNNLVVNNKYEVTLTFTGTTVPLTIKEAYVQTPNKTSTKFGGGSALKIIDDNDNTHTWEFYVDISNNNIHVWPSDNWVSPEVGSTLNIDFGTAENEIYHYADQKYLNIEFNMDESYVELSPSEAQFIIDNIPYIKIVKDGIRYEYTKNDYFKSVDRVSNSSKTASITYKDIYFSRSQNILNSNEESFPLFNPDNTSIWFKPDDIGNNQNVSLKTAVGGGFSGKPIPVSTSDFTLDGSDYVCTNSDFVSGILKTITFLSLTKFVNDQFFRFIDSSDNRHSKTLYWTNSYDSSTNTYTFTVDTNSDFLASSYNTFTYNNVTETFDFSSVKFTSGFYTFLSTYSIVSVLNSFPQYAQVIEPIEKKFIPLVKDIPDTPTTQGTYKLRCTVDAQGNPTFTWEADV